MINGPEALNALNSTVLDELFDVFNVIDKDDERQMCDRDRRGKILRRGRGHRGDVYIESVEGKRFAQKGHRVMNFIEKDRKNRLSRQSTAFARSAAAASFRWHAIFAWRP